MKLLKEPLLHFLLLGGAIFALNEWRARGKPVEAAQPRIDVSAGTIAWLCEGFARQWHRAPDADELRGLVDDHVREELLHREALALGLDRDDTIVRRRLAQKMEFLTQDVAAALEPDEAALRAYFEANAPHYAATARLSFHQVYFSKERRGAALDVDASAALDALRHGASEESVGDPFLGEHTFTDVDAQAIASALGPEFATAVAPLPVGDWRGPVASSYGVHLVRVTERTDAQPVAFEAVRDAVERDLADDRRRAANGAFLERLKARYRITVDETAMRAATDPSVTTAQR